MNAAAVNPTTNRSFFSIHISPPILLTGLITPILFLDVIRPVSLDALPETIRAPIEFGCGSAVDLLIYKTLRPLYSTEKNIQIRNSSSLNPAEYFLHVENFYRTPPYLYVG